MAIILNNATTPVSRTAAFTTVTTAGSVTAGAKSISIANAGTKNGTVAGNNLFPGMSLSFDASGTDVLAAVAYDPTKDASSNTTGTTFLITTLI